MRSNALRLGVLGILGTLPFQFLSFDYGLTAAVIAAVVTLLGIALAVTG